MPKTKEQKAQQIKALQVRLSSSKAAVLAEFTGLTMEDLDDVRQKAREQSISFQVVKNTLLTKAAEMAGIKELNVSKIARQLLMATSEDDEIAVSKLIHNLAKSSGNRVKIYSGVIDKKIVPLDMIMQLAQLPTREELLARVVGSISAPVSGLVRVLGSPFQSFYNVIKALAGQMDS